MIVDAAAVAQLPAGYLNCDDSEHSQKHVQMARMFMAACLMEGIYPLT